MIEINLQIINQKVKLYLFTELENSLYCIHMKMEKSNFVGSVNKLQKFKWVRYFDKTVQIEILNNLYILFELKLYKAQ